MFHSRYLTTHFAGMDDSGTVFKIEAITGLLTTVVEFADKGREPMAGLVIDGNGYLWGTTSKSGTAASGYGTIFKVHTITGALTTLVKFTDDGKDNQGRHQQAGLVRDRNGCFWGTTSEGGQKGRGTVYKINPSTGVLTTVVDFGRLNNK